MNRLLKNKQAIFLFMLPVVILFLMIVAAPVFLSGYYSLLEWDGMGKQEDVYKRQDIFCTMTGGKYKKVSIDEELKIDLFTEERHVPLFMASQGTIEQVYLALRIAVGDIFCCEETMPLLLDEVFAMYDEERMKETLG